MNRKLKAAEGGLSELTAAGVSVALTQELARRFPPSVICDHIQSLLEARLPDKTDKDGKVIEGRPDAMSRGTGLRILLGYAIGEPIKRLAVQDITPRESDGETQERIAQSPAALRAMAAALAESPDGRAAIEAALAPRKKGKAEIIEAEPGNPDE